MPTMGNDLNTVKSFYNNMRSCQTSFEGQKSTIGTIPSATNSRLNSNVNSVAPPQRMQSYTTTNF